MRKVDSDGFGSLSEGMRGAGAGAAVDAGVNELMVGKLAGPGLGSDERTEFCCTEH